MSWQKLTKQGFWEKFSSNGKPMTYKAICEKIQKERMARDHTDAICAKEEYGDRFDSVFVYRKGHNLLVMNQEAAIARRYRTLHGLD